MSRSEQRTNSVRELGRKLMWMITEDMSKISMTPDLALLHINLISAQVHTLRHLALTTKEAWVDFQLAYRQLDLLADLSSRPYGTDWQNYCHRVCFEAGKEVNFGKPIQDFLPPMSADEFKKIGQRQGFVSESKSLLGKAHWVINS